MNARKIVGHNMEKEYRDELVRIQVTQGYTEAAARFNVDGCLLKYVIAIVENYRRLGWYEAVDTKDHA